MGDQLFAARRIRWQRFAAPAGWQPSADIYRTPRGWLIKFELAGVGDGEVSVALSGGCLVIRGRRVDLEQLHGCHCHALEIAYSEFARVVELPEPIEGARVATAFRNGMFLVSIERNEEGA